METRIDEIADGIYRLSTFFPEVVPPAGFTINQFLVLADEPLLFHCGLRAMFPSSLAAVAKLLPVERLRWITFGHFEADECGSMNDWLAVAPEAQVAHGAIACDLSLIDMVARPPRVLADGEVPTSAVSGSATSTPPTCHTVGTPGWSTRKRPRPCSAAICSRRSAMARR